MRKKERERERERGREGERVTDGTTAVAKDLNESHGYTSKRIFSPFLKRKYVFFAIKVEQILL